MPQNRPPSEERKRRKRELILILCLLPLVALLTFAETHFLNFGADFPLSHTLLMFAIININLLLLLLLIFLVFRNLVKLYYDRKQGQPGAKLRTRLLIAFVTLTLLPTTVLFIFSINFISTSIAFWFNVPVEQALENSISVGRHIYTQTTDNNRFFIEKTADEIQKKKLLHTQTAKALQQYAAGRLAALPMDTLDIHDPKGKILFSAKSEKLDASLTPLSPEEIFRLNINDTGTKNITETFLSGELIRTIAAIPFRAENEAIEGYLVMGSLIPTTLIRNLEAISQGSSEYQQVKLLRQPVQQVYYLALTIVALLVLFCAIWFAFYLARTITTPLMELAHATRRIGEGDLGFQIAPAGDDEIGILVNAFNRMTRDLQMGQEQLALSARMLRQQNAEIEERRRYIETILKNVSAGVISFNSSGIVTTINPSAEKMLGLSAGSMLKRPYKKSIPETYRKLAENYEKTIRESKSDLEFPISLTVDNQPRNFHMHFSALMDDTGRRMGTVMVFDDVTELEKAQRMAAWREVARRIAHEVKNPLTPLSLSAQRLRRKYKNMLEDPVFNECTRTIMDHVDVIRNLVNEFAEYARFPAARLRPGNLKPLVSDTVAAFREAHPGIRFSFHAENHIPRIPMDAQQTHQLLLNLLGNAAGALGEKGEIQVALFRPSGKNILRLEIRDNGPGISPEEKGRLFEPYYSTKSSGTGLGLAIVNSIVTEHKASIEVLDNSPSGACFRIDYPLHEEE
ncbi:PAS/PAC sensor signal transduction histidine kinase [Desulfobotulus alkaliphilus]|uniref:histidine kinase n=1 Tax=Desulfobotulus alkaliphilus TaxID=622671 RepID=A0A562S261_9BACT|nr:ATP-binding protein [Desulfobotulus alkaliphilus]TWI75412.1 PAS/PAC sensor signal transduction histidine kinase [Desulfobotulus alkaliphilus]